MHDERLTRLLRDLPREEASPYFTAGVVRRLRQESSETRLWRRLAWAASLAVAVTASALGVRELAENRAREQERRAAIERLAALEAEKRALEAEIRSLSRLATEAQGVVYLGSTPNLDVVVDLNRLARRRSSQGAAVRPAHNPGGTDSGRFVYQGEKRR